MTTARPTPVAGQAAGGPEVRRRELVVAGPAGTGPSLPGPGDTGVAVLPAVERTRSDPARSVVASPDRLPFRAGAFAKVTSEDALEQVRDDATAVAELARVTASGGAVELSTRNRHHLLLLADAVRARAAGRRLLPVAADAAGAPSRGYCWGEVEELVRPVLHIRARRPVGRRPRPGEPALLGRLLQLPLLWRFSEIVRLEATPR